MTGTQVLRQVEMPNALPLLYSGIRSAVLQVVATATIAAYIGLGGLGRYLIDGIALGDYARTAGGAVIVAVLALVARRHPGPRAAPRPSRPGLGGARRPVGGRGKDSPGSAVEADATRQVTVSPSSRLMPYRMRCVPAHRPRRPDPT